MARDLALSAEDDSTSGERRSSRYAAVVWRALWRRKIARIAIIYIALFYTVGIFAAFIAPYDYREQDLDQTLQKPSWSHPFGTDRLGRDLFSRVLYAARTTAVITIITAITGGLIIGDGLGLLAGYRGGWADNVINRVGEGLGSLPSLLVLILLTATIGPRLNNWVANYYDLPVIGQLLKEGFASILVLIFVLSLIGWVGSMRLIRALTLSVRNTDYVQSARACGAGTARVLLFHVLPNISYIIILGTAAAFGSIAVAEIGISFLGLGVRPPTPSFGSMILEGFNSRTFNNYPWLLLFPSFFAVMLLLSFNLLGDALNDVLNPRTRDL